MIMQTGILPVVRILFSGPQMSFWCEGPEATFGQFIPEKVNACNGKQSGRNGTWTNLTPLMRTQKFVELDARAAEWRCSFHQIYSLQDLVTCSACQHWQRLLLKWRRRSWNSTNFWVRMSGVRFGPCTAATRLIRHRKLACFLLCCSIVGSPSWMSRRRRPHPATAQAWAEETSWTAARTPSATRVSMTLRTQD